MIRNCQVCARYQCEEVGDSDYGAIYADNPSCEKENDLDKNEEYVLANFDREIERDCCELDFFKVLDVDEELRALFGTDDKDFLYEGKALKRFKEKYS